MFEGRPTRNRRKPEAVATHTRALLSGMMQCGGRCFFLIAWRSRGKVARVSPATASAAVEQKQIGRLVVLGARV